MRLTKSQKSLIRSMYDAGYSTYEISKRLEISEYEVDRVLGRL